MTSRVIWIAFALLVVAMPVAAQPVGEWYVVGTAGEGLALIGGGEAVVKDVVGVGLEAGALLGGLGFTFSPGAGFRIPSVGSVTPFVSAGARSINGSTARSGASTSAAVSTIDLVQHGACVSKFVAIMGPAFTAAIVFSQCVSA